MTDRLAREHPETQAPRTPPKIPGVLDLEDKDSTPPAPQVPMPGESRHGVQASGFQEILEELAPLPRDNFCSATPSTSHSKPDSANLPQGSDSATLNRRGNYSSCCNPNHTGRTTGMPCRPHTSNDYSNSSSSYISEPMRLTQRGHMLLAQSRQKTTHTQTSPAAKRNSAARLVPMTVPDSLTQEWTSKAELEVSEELAFQEEARLARKKETIRRKAFELWLLDKQMEAMSMGPR